MPTRPALQAAIDNLAGIITGIHRAGKSRLPPSRQLARQMGVSLPTVLRALAHYRDLKQLTICPGRGTHIVSEEQEPWKAPADPQPHKWQRIRQSLIADILAALNSPESFLPSRKQLCARYGASRITMSKALQRLVREKVLHETVHGWRPMLPAASGHGTVVLLALGSDDRELAIVSGRTADHLRALESACGRAGVTLAIVPCPDAAPALDIDRAWRRAVSVAGDGALLGVVVWAMSMKCDWKRFCATRPSPLLPIALLDEIGDEALAAATAGSRLVRLFSMANTSLAGENVGRWLLARGHRHTAFFSANHQAAFSINRLAGLAAAFESLGLSGNVYAYTESDLYHSPDVLHTLEKSAQLVREAAAHVRGASKRPGLTRQAIAASLDAAGRRIAFDEIEQWVMGRQFARAFQSCHDDTRVTAWVAVTDQTALACRTFLQAQTRPVTLVGFDNSPLASTYNLTSYDFNGAAVLQAMVSFVLEPRWKALHAAGNKLVEIPGYIVPREMAYRG